MTSQQAFDLALDHHRSGRLAQAEEIYNQILAKAPDYPVVLNLVGVLNHQLGRSARGAELLRRAIELDGTNAGFHNNLGELLRAMGQLDQAEACYQRCLQINPGFAGAFNNLGELYRQQLRFGDAIASYRRAVELNPHDPQAPCNLGVALHHAGRPDEAVEHYRRTIALAPAWAEPHGNLGSALMELLQPENALLEFRKAIELNPGSADAHVNLGTALTDLRQLDEAIVEFERALALDSQCGNAHHNLSFALLLRGNFECGWEEYEWRWKAQYRPAARVFKKPMWDGSDPNGRTILVHAEQGYGDTIQFVRYVPILASMGVKVILEVPAALRRLLRDLEGISQVLEPDQPAPEFDLHIPILSLPRAVKTRLATIPATIPYLSADPRMVEKWRGRLGPSDRCPRIGLIWAGNTEFEKDRGRRINLTQLAPLAGIEGVQWFSLQFGPPARQVPPSGLNLIDLTGEITDFADTAALMSLLDLIICGDSAPAHLAGALGRPTWIMLPFNCDWRWMLESQSSPWYPTARLFRQPKLGDWHTVISNVTHELAKEMRDSGLR